MTATGYSLVPHPGSPAANVRSVAFELVDRLDDLLLRVVIAGQEHVRFPELRAPGRVDGLWKTTCFELFLNPVGSDGYLEFNFSPSTEWAAYRFDGYRAGMRDFDIGAPPIIERAKPYAIEVALDRSAIPAVACTMALSAVIEEVDGTRSYWALAHAPGAPDFHNRDCFIATLPAVERP